MGYDICHDGIHDSNGSDSGKRESLWVAVFAPAKQSAPAAGDKYSGIDNPSAKTNDTQMPAFRLCVEVESAGTVMGLPLSRVTVR